VEQGSANSPEFVTESNLHTEKAALLQGALAGGLVSQNGKIHDPGLIKSLDLYAIEDVVELKIARFLEQIGVFYPENLYDMIMSKMEKPLIVQILRRVGGNQVQAAKILGINRNTLRKKIKLYGI